LQIENNQKPTTQRQFFGKTVAQININTISKGVFV
jgi:hypothetical protein